MLNRRCRHLLSLLAASAARGDSELVLDLCLMYFRPLRRFVNRHGFTVLGRRFRRWSDFVSGLVDSCCSRQAVSRPVDVRFFCEAMSDIC